jgi:D-3-phosphoglycerate dehydrogenase
MTQAARLKVLLTNPIHPVQQARLAETVDVVVAPDVSHQTIARLIADCDGIMVRSHLAADVFEHAQKMKYVVRHGVGLDMIPLQAAADKGIVVANLPGSNTQAVVEYVLAAMFAVSRGLVATDSTLRAHGWAAAKPMSNHRLEVAGSTCGIVGLGSIGRRLAEILNAIGVNVLGLTRRPETLPAGVKAVDKSTLLKTSDWLVLACPHTPQTHHMIDAAALAQVKPNACLINVARGPVVDTPAIIAALRENRLANAVLDVHEPAILSGDEAIFDVPNTLLTPHLAGITATSLTAMSHWAVDTMLALIKGERPSNVVKN